MSQTSTEIAHEADYNARHGNVVDDEEDVCDECGGPLNDCACDEEGDDDNE